MPESKKILLGVTGSIAAYKSALLVRQLVTSGFEVKVLMTDSAADFITPLTLSTLSKNPVYRTFYQANTGEWTNHVELGLWADLMVIAPASANTLAKMANGICDNLLLATYLSARCPVMFAPAMDLDMYAHEATQQNIATLIAHGNVMINPGTGELASGLSGEGRMAEPEEIVGRINSFFNESKLLQGKKALVTAGPTYERIDPVRFIGNFSSGKMGIEIAQRLAMLGADVTLICGPSAVKSNPKINRIDIESAAQMLHKCQQHFNRADIVVMSAAVADYTPATVADHKIKKNDSELNVSLTKTTDILKWMGEQKRNEQLLVGFALETKDELNYAREKLQKKNLDMVVMNSLNDKGAGFATDTNKITIIDRALNSTEYPLKSKKEVAEDIVANIVKLIGN